MQFWCRIELQAFFWDQCCLVDGTLKSHEIKKHLIITLNRAPVRFRDAIGQLSNI